MKSKKTIENSWFSMIFYDNAWSSSRLAWPVGVASALLDAQTHVPTCPSSLYYHIPHHTTSLQVHSVSIKVANKHHVKKNYRSKYY